MITLVLPPRITEDSHTLARNASRVGWDVERLPSWHIPPLLADEDVVLYAEPLFVLHAAPQLNVIPLEPPYDWLPTLPRQYLAREVYLTTLADARTLTAERFVKPAMEKFFRPIVAKSGQELPGDDAASARLPVLVSEVVRWEVEFRCFIKGRTCVTMSPYLFNNELTRTAEGEWIVDDALSAQAAAFVERFVGDPQVALPPAVVIDIGKIINGPWAVIEANPAWGSGIYGCDPERVLDAVRRSCVKRDRLDASDEPWVIDHAQEDFT